MSNIDVKQVIVLKKNVGMRRAKLASYIARASLQFLIDNDESKRRDEVFTKMNEWESLWLRNGQRREIFVAGSYDAMSEIAFKAQMLDIGVYVVHDENQVTDNIDEPTPVAIAIGPARSEDLLTLVSKLKKF